MNFNIEVDTRAVLRDIGFGVPDIARKAQITAINKTNSKVGTEFRRRFSRETGIKQKDFKGQVKQYRATYTRRFARVFFGMRRGIRMADLTSSPTAQYDRLARGTLHGRSGADAFKATVRTGNQGSTSGSSAGFFVRKGRDRLPISQVRVRFNEVGGPILESVGNQVGPAEYKRQFTYDMQRRLRNTSRGGRRGRGRRR